MTRMTPEQFADKTYTLFTAIASKNADPISDEERLIIATGLQCATEIGCAIIRIADAIERIAGPKPAADPLDGL